MSQAIPEQPAMNAVRLAEREFDLERAKALNAYAQLEQSLAGLFNTLLGTDMRKSYIIFSKIINVRSRRSILSELMYVNFGDQHAIFFQSLMKKIVNVDDMRNNIVHWIVRTSEISTVAFDPDRDIALHKHPNVFDMDKMYKHEIIAFRQKAGFMMLLVYFFEIYLRTGECTALGSAESWREIFQKPLSYPPPTDHPLYHKSIEP